MTNIVHSIEEINLNIAIGMFSEEDTEYKLFINRDFDPLCGEEYTSPLRTSYQGLMPEIFNLVYPLNDKEDTIVITLQGEKILFRVVIDNN